MAVAFDAKFAAAVSVDPAGTSSTALTVGAGSNRALLVFVEISAVETAPTTVTWDYGGGSPQSLIKIQEFWDAGYSGTTLQTWGLVAPHSGNLTLRFSGGSGSCVVDAASFTGVVQDIDLAFPIDSQTSNQGYSSTATVSVPSAIGDMVVAHHASLSLFTAVNQTSIYQASTFYWAANRAAGATSVTLTASLSQTDGWQSLGLNVKASAAIPCTAPNLAVGSPIFVATAVTQKQIFSAPNLAIGSPSFTATALTRILLPINLTIGSPTFGSATVSQKFGLAAVNLAISSPVFTATNAGTPLSAATYVASAPKQDSPPTYLYLSSVNAVVAINLTVGSPTVPASGLTEIHALTAPNLTVGSPPVTATGIIEVLSAPYLTIGTATVAVGVLTQLHGLATRDLILGSPTFAATSIVKVLSAPNLVIGSPSFTAPATAICVNATAADCVAPSPSQLGPSFALTIGSDNLGTPPNLVIGSPLPGVGALSQKHVFAAPPNLTVASPILMLPGGTNVLPVGNLTIGSPTFAAPLLAKVLRATSLTIGSPLLGVGALTQKHAFAKANLTIGSPLLQAPTAYAGTLLIASPPLTIGSPVLGQPKLSQKQALAAQALLTGSPVFSPTGLWQIYKLTAPTLAIGSPTFIAPLAARIYPLRGPNLTVGVPVFGAPRLAQIHLLRTRNVVAARTIFGVPDAQGFPVDPVSRHAAHVDDGVQESIVTNINSDLQFMVSPFSLVGSTRGTWGEAQKIVVSYPLTFANLQLGVDFSSLQAQIDQLTLDLQAEIAARALAEQGITAAWQLALAALAGTVTLLSNEVIADEALIAAHAAVITKNATDIRGLQWFAYTKVVGVTVASPTFGTAAVKQKHALLANPLTVTSPTLGAP